MNLFTRMANRFGLVKAAIFYPIMTSRTLTLSQTGELLSNEPNYAGQRVSDATALTLSAWWACVRLLAGTMSTLPVNLMQWNGGVPRTVDKSPLQSLLQHGPNEDQSSVDFFDFLFCCLLVGGNSYARIKRNVLGTISSVTPLPYDIVTVKRDDRGRLRYKWSIDGKTYDVDEDEIFHVRGPGGNPLGGMSTLSYARHTLGTAMAADRAAGGVFKNGIRPSGALTAETWMPDGKRDQYKKILRDEMAGAENTGKPLVLEGGMKWQQITMNPDDAQMLESRKFSVEDICRFFGVPPFMIGHTEKSTSWGTGLSEQVLGFQKFTLRPLAKRFEAAMCQQLLSDSQRQQGYYIEFNFEGLLRGDAKARAEFYDIMTRIGVMNVDECREKEGLPPVPGGDKNRTQMQMIPLDAPYVPQQAERPTKPTKEDA